MAFCDFVIKYNPANDSMEDITERIIYAVFIKRLKARKPCIIFVGGDSGEGKSYSDIKLEEIMLKVQGLDIKNYFDDVNVYTPLEYPTKLKRILHEKSLKKVNVLCMHEAREIVKAKKWQSFLTQAVADVNAMSRSIKRLAIIITSQFIRDITNDMRYTLNYYITVRRPKGQKARLYINVLWKDDRDLEKPKLRRRKLSGYIIYPNGKRRRYIPKYLELRKPDKDLCERFEKADYEAKAMIIRQKLNKLIEEMKTEAGVMNQRIDGMVKWYLERPDELSSIGKRHKGNWKLKPEFRAMVGISVEEAEKFEEILNKEMVKKGMVEVE
jgi:hypothetical protein